MLLLNQIEIAYDFSHRELQCKLISVVQFVYLAMVGPTMRGPNTADPGKLQIVRSVPP